MKPAILTDLTRCVGCQACVFACKEINGLSREPAERLSADSWTVVQRRQGLAVRRQCMHCLEPACASVCPVGAMHKTAEGPVVWDGDKCIGCRYCMIGCPYSVPTYQWDSPVPAVRKCIMCYSTRIKEGRQPACTEACPAGATIFGDREQLLTEARKRIADHPDKYVNHIYGMNEGGGASVLYLSPVAFEKLGFPGVDEEPYPELTWAVLGRLPQVVSVLGVAMAGIWWITHRRDEVARAEEEEASKRLDDARKRSKDEAN